MNNNKKKIPKELLRLNLLTSLIIVIINVLIFICLDKSKSGFFIKSLYCTGIILIIYLFLLIQKIKTRFSSLKKEILYINYKLNTIILAGVISLTLSVSALTLLIVNKDAVNAVFIFIFFMSTMSMLMPVIVYLVFVFFVVPIWIIPSIKTPDKVNSIRYIIILILILFILLTLNFVRKQYNYIQNYRMLTKFQASKLSMNYSTEYLKLNDTISAYAQKKMSRDTVKVPIFYLTKPMPSLDINSAFDFCNSLDARVPNYLEAYHIIFNRFDTFGDKYYWTSDNDNGIPLVLHFKNMSYELVKLPQGVYPELYCMVNADENTQKKNNFFFYRENEKLMQSDVKKSNEKKLGVSILDDIKNIIPHNTEIPSSMINTEKKRINYSVKEVSQDVMQELINKGYNYNPADTIESKYEINSAKSYMENNTDREIRLCYYPFTDYGNLSMDKEREIWEQSFCSPAFDLIDIEPALKTKGEKDIYCTEKGGRLPNIPELTGILKARGKTEPNIKYWTNNKVKGTHAISRLPVLVYFKDSRFLKVEAVEEDTDEYANVYCIKNPQVPSLVITNYKSKFMGVEGGFLAKQKCMNCRYFEVPDVILQH